jgi:hypothetical protein
MSESQGPPQHIQMHIQHLCKGVASQILAFFLQEAFCVFSLSGPCLLFTSLLLLFLSQILALCLKASRVLTA